MVKSHNTYLQDGWDVTVAKNLGDIEALRPVWEQIQAKEPYPVLNADIDRYISVVESLGQRTEPHVTVLSRRGVAEAMIVGRLQTTKLECKIGYKTLFSPSIRCLSVVYRGIIGNLTDGTARRVVQELRNILRRGDADAIFINHLRVSSPVYPLVRRVPGPLSRGHFLRVESHRRMLLPKTIGEFYQSCSKKHRGNLRRYIRKLNGQYQDEVKVVTCCGQDDMEEAIKAMVSISAKTYQYSLGSGFVGDVLTRTLLRTAAESGWLRTHILFIGDEPCAFQLGLHYGRTYFLNQIGFDPRWKQLNVGTILFIKVLEQLCSDHTTDYLDFGFGEADYKQSYGNEHWSEASVYIFAPRLYPIVINILRTSTRSLDSGLQYFLNKTVFACWIKRRWRNLLQKKSQESTR